MSDFQKCPECNKTLDLVCVCTPDNYYVQLPVSDHVSKKALREWCEEKLKRLSILRSMDHNYFEKFSAELLDQFCKEGE